MSKFKQLVDKLESKGMSEKEAGGIAYNQGVKKYGKRKMLQMAIAGRKKAE